MRTSIAAMLAGAALVASTVLVNGQAPSATTGHLVDVMCAGEHAEEGAAFGAKHDKSCLLMDSCVKSGYAVLTADNRVVKLDGQGNTMALELIKKTDKQNDWRVSVEGPVSNGVIAVSKITLQ
jgi:hypothetical protein